MSRGGRGARADIEAAIAAGRDAIGKGRGRRCRPLSRSKRIWTNAGASFQHWIAPKGA